MFCVYTRPRYQVSVYRTIGPLVYKVAGQQWLSSKMSALENVATISFFFSSC